MRPAAFTDHMRIRLLGAGSLVPRMLSPSFDCYRPSNLQKSLAIAGLEWTHGRAHRSSTSPHLGCRTHTALLHSHASSNACVIDVCMEVVSTQCKEPLVWDCSGIVDAVNTARLGVQPLTLLCLQAEAQSCTNTPLCSSLMLGTACT